MARKVTTIYNVAVAQYVANALAAGIVIDPTKWSKYNYQRLIFWTMAFCQSLLEQIMDSFKVDVEAIVAVAYPQTSVWIQNLILNIFQYDSTTPQIIQIDPVTFVPTYAITDSSKLLVTQCVVVPGTFGTTQIKVAQGSVGSSVALSTPELSALQSTLNTVIVPGVTFNAISLDADEIFIGATVTYNGQYASQIPIANGTVVQAIQNYFASIPASGVVTPNSIVGLMKLTDLILAVRSVPGVIDFELNNVNGRAALTSFVPGTYNLVLNNTWLNNEWQSGSLGAGYMTTETTTGYTINDSLIYNAA